MITPAQMRAARALLGWDQRRLAKEAGISLPTIRRMETSDGNVRGNVDSLVKVVEALDRAGVTLLAEGDASPGGGRGVRMKGEPTS
jgi:transcriptional regulator with XRE-family HTH domain